MKIEEVSEEVSFFWFFKQTQFLWNFLENSFLSFCKTQNFPEFSGRPVMYLGIVSVFDAHYGSRYFAIGRVDLPKLGQ